VVLIEIDIDRMKAFGNIKSKCFFLGQLPV